MRSTRPSVSACRPRRFASEWNWKHWAWLPQPLRSCHRAVFLHHFLKSSALDVFHDQEVRLALLVDVVSADDVGVVQGGDGLGFAVEPAQASRVRQTMMNSTPIFLHVLVMRHLYGKTI